MDNELNEALTDFSEMFQARIIEMAMSDISIPNRILAIEVMSIIEDFGTNEEVNSKKLVELGFHPILKIRNSVVPYISKILRKELVPVKSKAIFKKTTKEDDEIYNVLLVSCVVDLVMENLKSDSILAESVDSIENKLFSALKPSIDSNVYIAIERLVSSLWLKVDILKVNSFCDVLGF